MAIGAVFITLLADRVAVAEQVSALSVKVETAREGHDTIMAKLTQIETKVDSNAIILAQVSERQEEVRRVLRLK